MDKINGIIKNDTVEPDELSAHENDIVTIEGFIHRIREMTGFSFVIVRTRRDVVQCIYAPEFSDFRKHCGKLLGEDYGQGCHQPGREGQQAL